MARKHTGLAAALALLSLAGCAAVEQPEPQPLPPAVASAAEGVTVTKVERGKFLALVGPRKQHAPPFLDVANTNYYCLRSFLDTRSGEVAHQLYVQYSYQGGPRKWTGAHDQHDRELRFIALNRNEITCEFGCSYAEEFAAALPESLLRQNAGDLAVTFTGEHGTEKTIAVDRELVAKELAAIDAVRATVTAEAKPVPAAVPTPPTAEKPATAAEAAPAPTPR